MFGSKKRHYRLVLRVLAYTHNPPRVAIAVPPPADRRLVKFAHWGCP